MIARLPIGRWELSETRGIAAHLVELLPRRGSVGGAEPAKADAIKRAQVPAVLLLVVALGLAAFLGLVASSQLPWLSSYASGSNQGIHPSE